MATEVVGHKVLEGQLALVVVLPAEDFPLEGLFFLEAGEGLDPLEARERLKVRRAVVRELVNFQRDLVLLSFVSPVAFSSNDIEDLSNQ